MVMSDSSSPADANARPGRVAKFKGLLKRRGGRFPVILLLIVALSIAMVYSFVTSVMM
jgi:hypothetical protein